VRPGDHGQARPRRGRIDRATIALALTARCNPLAQALRCQMIEPVILRAISIASPKTVDRAFTISESGPT